MDPLTAFSLAGTIIQFVDYGTKILRGSKGLYDSASGASVVNDEIETRTKDLLDLVIKLRRPLSLESTSADYATYTALRELCNGCRKVADELIARLQRLKDIDMLCKRLSEFRRSLDTHILSSLRYL
jgi:hypothetical protein